MKTEHDIWKIGLFDKVSPEEAHCSVCKKEGKKKHSFKLSNGTIKSLKKHLESELHATSEYSDKYKALMANKNTDPKMTEHYPIVSSGI